MNPFLKELFRGNIGAAVKVATNSVSVPYGPIPIDPSRYTTPDGGPGWMFEMGGAQYSYFKYAEYSDGVTAYTQCPPLASILNAKAQAMANGKTWVLSNSDGKESQSREAKIIRELIRRPNPIQSWKQFESQLSIFMDLFGFAIILPIKPAGFDRMLDTTSMWNIPASWIDVQLTMERFSKVGGAVLEEIIVNFGGTRTLLKLKELIIIRGSTPSFNTLTFPGSKITSLQMAINNIIGAMESRNMLINYRGALGILTADAKGSQYNPIPIGETEKEQLQVDMRRYGLRRKQLSFIITTAAMKWQQMGYPTKDLMLMEEVQECSLLLCNGFNFPPFLQGLKDSTFNNQRAAMKGLYENCVIPDAESIYEQLSDAFELEKYGIRIDKDFGHIPAMQEDKKEAADARKALNDALAIEWKTGLITLDEWRIKLDEDPLPNDRGNLYYDEYVKKYGGGTPEAEPKANVNINVKYDPTEPRDSSGRWTTGGYANVEINNAVGVENPHQYLKMCGIPEDFQGKVSLTDSSGWILIKGRGEGFEFSRRYNTETKAIENRFIEIENGSRFKGKGAFIFNKQVEQSSLAGYKKIRTVAKKSSGANGYYTWARLGYKPDTGYNPLKMGETISNFNSKNSVDVKSFEELMSTKSGQQHWKENGFEFKGEFDLTPGSYSRNTLKNYIDGKKRG